MMVYQFSDVLHYTFASAKATADGWLDKLSPGSSFAWSEEQAAIPIDDQGARTWRGTAKVGPLLLVADIYERRVGW